MIDFKKKLNKGEPNKKTNPLEIYESLDRRSVTGPIRPAQQQILEDWFLSHISSKDLIVKLHTGEGKTLIGLLILQSHLNQGNGPCAFVCPNKYLVKQVALEAEKFGIPYCIMESGQDLPEDFLEGKKVLITNVNMLFNGKSKFGIENSYTEIGCIILDDSHACIDAIKDSFCIKIDKSTELYTILLSIFEHELIEQGEGDFHDIKEGIYESFLPVPYWTWIDKKSEITELLSKNKDLDSVKFTWPIIKNSIEHCNCYVAGDRIEIIPNFIPISVFGSFAKAKQRILMSATTQDDSFFIKGLGFDIDSVKKPLTNKTQHWSGEKMILIPSLIDDLLDRDLIVTAFTPPGKLKYGRVALVPSFKKSNQYRNTSSHVANADSIFEDINKLKQGDFEKTIVIVNRYDGIDLPDQACRILIVDSMPYFNSLNDRYEEKCRINSEITNVKFAQKIEQGFGRSVRGEKDYSIILVIGDDLVKFIKSVKTKKFFSAQTQKQIEIGIKIAEMAKEGISQEESATKIVTSLIKQSITRDEGWKEFYKEQMDELSDATRQINIYEILSLERQAEEASFKGDNETACIKMQLLIDNHLKNVDSAERSWYLQQLAKFKYFVSKSESNQIQKSAFSYNLQLLKPRDGVTYKKLEYINENRIKRIKDWISNFGSYDELTLNLNEILNDLSFGVDSEKFENAVYEMGKMLGFVSQRPDKEIKKGPDNLWCGVDGKYFLIECKNEVDEKRSEISKYEAGQMNSHCGWFETIYGEAKVKRILIIPTKNLSYYGNFTHQVEIMRPGKLKSLKEAIRAFFKEFKSYNIQEISDEKIQHFIKANKLEVDNLINDYTEGHYHNDVKNSRI